MQKPVGPKMEHALAIIRENPGCPKIVPARAVSPLPAGQEHGCWGYGYEPVNRLIRRGLVRAERTSSGAYKLYAAD